ncbi:ATP-dependent helicase [Maritimibacter sp. HL-12]|uniref:ATP-dependent helicase n=1 Tax=Maritimibacter sp. HL-12 TaxID=1162418 RepID=UPI000A0F1F7C|nr:UvrD-helicase domain-containing protein [Maritimibacter sp. HL-12]SMH53837.1 DNA helicase-2 / ATP-dependent DNA helicase PcrA [Maritimibacter sp. HL-12]
MSHANDPSDLSAPRPSLSQMAMAARPMPYLDDLNPAQRAAVEALEGPVLMLAGAGTGKTKALTTRIAHLLGTGAARTNEILAVTFTNKAAREMKERVARLLGQGVEGMPWLGTFHAICVKLLRRHAELVGLKSNFTILDTDDQVRLLKQLIVAEGIDVKELPPRALAGFLDKWKNQADSTDRVAKDLTRNGLGAMIYFQYFMLKDLNFDYGGSPSTKIDLGSLGQVLDGAPSEAQSYSLHEYAHVIQRWLGQKSDPKRLLASIEHNGIGAKFYPLFQARLRALNAVDFGDLLLHVVRIFQEHEDVLEQYQRWFRYILVDEYQDTNVAQYLWLRLLAARHKNICCVGDDDQSIYGWRGAEVGNILRFEKDFPGAKVIRLEQNYRSTPHILAAAAGVIRGNEDRLGKELWTEAEDGEKVRLIGHWDGEEEARWIGDEIEAMQAGSRGMAPMSLDDMAILVRASHQMRAFEDRFLTIGLPYRVIGGPRFYERMEIRDAMAYFRLAVSPDDDLAFERIVNTPRRGLGDKAVQTIARAARGLGVSLVEGARAAVERGEIKGKGGKALDLLVRQIDRWQAQVQAEADTHVELAEQILDESGYTGMWQNDKTPEAPGRLENLKELVKALEEFENLQGFLEHVSLIMDNETEAAEEKVTIMTLHAAKGLEYPAVFLPGWEDGLFPSQRSMDESGLKGLEEERRLAYVGITRAEELCTISFAANRRVYGQWQSQLPSRFIDELPEAHVDVLTPPGLYGGGYGAAGGMSSRLEEQASRADAYNSPGWKRMQARGAARGMQAPNEARNLVIDATAVSAFSKGDRVFHQKFGYGYVMGIEGDKLDIEFEKAGAKKVVARFIQSADRAGDDVPF